MSSNVVASATAKVPNRSTAVFTLLGHMALPCESLGMSGEAGGGTVCVGLTTGVAGAITFKGGALLSSRPLFLVAVIEAGMLCAELSSRSSLRGDPAGGAEESLEYRPSGIPGI